MFGFEFESKSKSKSKWFRYPTEYKVGRRAVVHQTFVARDFRHYEAQPGRNPYFFSVRTPHQPPSPHHIFYRVVPESPSPSPTVNLNHHLPTHQPTHHPSPPPLSRVHCHTVAENALRLSKLPPYVCISIRHQVVFPTLFPKPDIVVGRGRRKQSKGR
jgi:hypothetical protein